MNRVLPLEDSRQVRRCGLLAWSLHCKWLSGCLSSAIWFMRFHTLMPLWLQVKMCRVKELMAVTNSSSWCFSTHTFCSIWGTINLPNCMSDVPGLFQRLSKTSESQEKGFRNLSALLENSWVSDWG